MIRASRRKFHLIYKTTCLETGKYYVGMHSTDDLDDGYLGSGRWLINSVKKYGKEKHVREIIEFVPTREQLRIREEQIVDQKMIDDDLCMNLDLGGQTGDFKDRISTCEKMRLAKLGKKQSPEWIEARRKGLMGHVQTEETKEKLRKIAREQWDRRRAGDMSAVGRIKTGVTNHERE